MEAPSITIKYKGLAALHALGQDPLLSPGTAILGKGALKGTAEIETKRLAATGKGTVLKTTEVETKWVAVKSKGAACPLGYTNCEWTFKGAGKALGSKTAATKVAVAGGKTAASGGQVAMAAAKGSGTIWTGTGFSLGLGLGLGALGPVLALGALGLTATGIYLYRKSAAEAEGLLEDEIP